MYGKLFIIIDWYLVIEWEKFELLFVKIKNVKNMNDENIKKCM